MVRNLFSVLFSISLVMPSFGFADVLFEGYQKIISGGTHIGYTVSRYSYDPKKKQYSAIYFIKTGAMGGDNTESVRALADDNLNPISYEYTSMMGKEIKIIDAKFLKGKMSAKVSEGKKSKTIKNDIPKGTFLSSFLVYLMLKSKTGIQTDSKYNYKAIAEEDGSIENGLAVVGKEETIKNFRAFKITNQFKGIEFISYVNDRGEVLSTNSPALNLTTELVATPSEAIGEFPTSSSILKSLFGDVPLGNINVVSKANMANALSPGERSKQEGVPQGEGILIKGK